MRFNPVTMGKRIRLLRKQNDLTQYEVAGLLSMAQGHYSVMERGKQNPTIPQLIKLSQILKVSIDYIITGKESTMPSRGLLSEDINYYQEVLKNLPNDLLNRRRRLSG